MIDRHKRFEPPLAEQIVEAAAEIAKLDGRLVILLDLECVFSGQEQSELISRI